MTQGRAAGAARWGVAVWCGLAAAACSDGNRVADRVSCYPACLADIVLLCPMLSGCDTTAGTNHLISDADISTGVSTCFASGEKRWEATYATTDDTPGAPAAVTCNGTTTTVQENATCFRLPWTSAMACEQLPCDFGALPAGATN